MANHWWYKDGGSYAQPPLAGLFLKIGGTYTAVRRSFVKRGGVYVLVNSHQPNPNTLSAYGINSSATPSPNPYYRAEVSVTFSHSFEAGEYIYADFYKQDAGVGGFYLYQTKTISSGATGTRSILSDYVYDSSVGDAAYAVVGWGDDNGPGTYNYTTATIYPGP